MFGMNGRNRGKWMIISSVRSIHAHMKSGHWQHLHFMATAAKADVPLTII